MSDHRIDPIQFNGGVADTFDNVLRLCVRLGEMKGQVKKSDDLLFTRLLEFLTARMEQVYGDSDLPVDPTMHTEALALFEGDFEEAKARLVKAGEFTAETIMRSPWKQYYSDLKRAVELGCPFLECTDTGERKYKSRGSINRFRKQALADKEKAEAEERMRIRAKRAIDAGEAESFDDWMRQQQAAPNSAVGTNEEHVIKHDKDDPFSGLRDDTKAAFEKLLEQARRLDGSDKGHVQLMIHLDKLVTRSLAGAVKHIAKVAAEQADSDEKSTTSKAA